MGKKWFRRLFRRRVFVTLMILLQLGAVIYSVWGASEYSSDVGQALKGISLLVVLYLMMKREKAAYKLTWMLLILMFPVFGGLLYLLFRCSTSARVFRKQLDQVDAASRPLFFRDHNALGQAAELAPECLPQMWYLQEYAGFPVYQHTQTEYLTPGERKFQRMLEEMEKAEKYIFLEYFIINGGEMWRAIQEVLERKAKQGVDVRLIYDDLGCFLRVPEDFPKRMGAKGIKCVVFNPFRPALSSLQNNRDHRKILVVDGKVAITGGINLADEYINAVDRFGHWKDASLLVRGAAAWSFTLMFLRMWSLTRREQVDYESFYPWGEGGCTLPSEGLVQPYSDSPLDQENVGEHVYLQIINNAKSYLYINSPYLIIDDSMTSALCLAAKSGVDVRIVTPHRWDKWLVHMTTRSYYRELVQAGVKVYEYSKGFLHSKTFVSDDKVATVGTTNLDFRSLYLHFECGVWMYGTPSVMEIKRDYLETLESCQRITLEDCQNNPLVRLFQEVLRVFAPLM